MKRFKIEFSKLIGNKYSIEIKMAVLDWMLKTGKGIEHRYGWNVDGINKSLFGYSANNYNSKYSLPNTDKLNWYFDAIFARAVFAPENKPLKTWRENESIYPDKYRMLNFNNEIPECKQPWITYLISDIQDFKDKSLKKEFHHPEYEERTEPKIIDIKIYTIGYGWIVEYMFSFKIFDYEPGWIKGYIQDENESVWEFLKRSYDELCKVVKPVKK